MKTFKNKAGNALATLAENTVWISNLKGKIYKQFPIQTLNLENFEEAPTDFPGDFEKAKSKFLRADAKKKLVAAKRRRIAEEKHRHEVQNLCNIRKALTAGQPVYGVEVNLLKYSDYDNDYAFVCILDGYPKYFAHQAEYEQALEEARSLEPCSGEMHSIEFGKLRPSISWLDFVKRQNEFSEITDNQVEVRKPDYHEIGGASLIVVWSWQTHVGYCRKMEGVYPASDFGIKTEEDLITGNEDRVNRQNFSVLLPADKLKDYCHGAEYDDRVAEMIADALNEDSWRWQYYQKFDADFVKENLAIDFVGRS